MPLMAVKLKNQFNNAFPLLETHLKNIRINGDPRGCSGFVVNVTNGKIAYLTTEESVYGPLQGKIMYRTAEHLKDYSGGRNLWTTPDKIVSDVWDLLQ
jgi:hypothetical protein